MNIGSQTTNRIAALCLFGGLLLCYSAFVLRTPIFTWDVVPYVAVTLASPELDARQLHEQTYAHLAEVLPPASYQSLSAGSYAAAMAQDPMQFASQLPMYQVKPGYVWLLKILHAAGLEPVAAIMLLSWVSGLLFTILLFAWLRHHCSVWAALLLVGLFIPAARLVDISRVPVPDNLSALVVLFGVYALRAKKWLGIGCLFLVFAILVRVNNIVYVAPLLAYQGFSAYQNQSNRLDRAVVLPVLALLAGIGGYFTITLSNGHQWWRLFYHTLVEPIADLNSFDQPFSLGLYLQILRSAAAQLLASGGLVNTVLPVFLVVGGIAAMNPAAGRSNLRVSAALFVPTLLVYFLLFPLVSGWDRFFTPFYALLLVFACEVAASGKEGVVVP